MHYDERPVPPELAGIATRAWFLEAPPVRRFEKIMPLPWVHLIVNLSDPYALYARDGTATTVSDAFVSGLQSEYLVIEPPSLIRHVGIELTPAGLHALSPGAGARTAGRVIDARDVLDGVDGLVAMLDAAATSAGCIDALVDFVLRARHADPDALVTSILAAIDTAPDVAFGQLAGDLGVSHRTLIGRFRAVTGTTPKQHAQVVRFHRLLDAAQRHEIVSDWAGLAAASGYYDQPHVIRAFRRFSGWTPVEYARLVAKHGADAAHFVPLEQVPVSAQAVS